MSARRPTVYDVAARAGVSIATVSFALHQPDRVREATRLAVLDAARELGYVPSGSARGLALRHTGALGLYSYDLLLESRNVSPIGDSTFQREIESELSQGHDLARFPLYVDEVQRGFELECRRAGRMVLLCGDIEDQNTAARDLAGRVDGLAFFPGSELVDTFLHVSRGIPVVSFSSPPEDDGGIHHVCVRNDDGIHAVVDHLVERHRIRDLAFVGARSAPDIVERHDAFRAAMRKHGLDPRKATVDDTELTDDTFEVLRALVKAGRLPGALVCATDQMALSVLALMHRSGVRVPEDVAVTGFDGIVASRNCTPTLTTVRQPMVTMGRVAARLLLEHVRKPAAPAKNHRLPVRLVLGRSCGCP